MPTIVTRTTVGTTDVTSQAFCALADVVGYNPSCTTEKTNVTALSLKMNGGARCAWYCIPW